jgi:hypothetical protein
MSEELTVLKPQSLAVMGGVGLGSAIFKTRPATIELVPRTTRQTGAIPGTFRNMMTNEVIGITDEEGKVVKNEFKAVLLAVPQPQREWYKNDGKTFSADMKQCFSLDNVQPHPKAKNPPAMFCATCPKGDINWQKWRDGGRTPDLLPQCQMYYHLVLAERNSQQRYYMNVKGKSVKQFRDAMEMQMGPLLEKMAANVVMINRSRGYKLNKNTGQFDFVGLPEGVTEKLPAEPMPNIFDISFTVYATEDKDKNLIMGFKDFARMKPEDRKEFGALYQEYMEQRQQFQEAATQAAVTEQKQADDAVSEVVDAEYIASDGKDAPITL